MSNSTILFIGIFGIFLLIIGIWIVSRRIGCNTLIKGVFVKCNEIWSDNVTSYFPVFKYTYNDVEYELQSFDSIPKKLFKTYTSGNVYPIYINPGTPRDFVVNKRLKRSDIAIFAFGVTFVLFALLIFVTR